MILSDLIVGKCKCKKAGFACGSRCHGGEENKKCKNKTDAISLATI